MWKGSFNKKEYRMLLEMKNTIGIYDEIVECNVSECAD